MRRLLLPLLLTGLLAAPAPTRSRRPRRRLPATQPAPTARPAPPGPPRRRPVDLRTGTRQVVTVNRTSGYHARVTYWTKNGGDVASSASRPRDGRIGYSGLVRPRKRVQGSGKTPLGTYRLPWAFGMNAERDRWDASYRRVRNGDYWVLDNQSAYYNRYRNKSPGRLPLAAAGQPPRRARSG